MDSVKKEIKAVKESSSSLDSQLKEVEKHALNEMSEKPGVYHVRFLELVLELLRTIKMKMGESNTWLQAMMSKKKKRGSLFASLSKKKGTQYSLSQELQAARSIQ